ncbi:MAG: phenol hydroxylase [Gammaproteobacteria bacterium]|nr:phenol hydroxylase [Gammaproteobacteria bacterium]
MRDVRKLGTAADGNEGATRYVRVTNADRRGNVEFQFSIGDPCLYLEMILPSVAFAEFCREHKVAHLNEEEARKVDAQENKWRFGDEQEE